MKDTLITARRKKTEIITALVCFALAFLLNIVCILVYKTPFKEVFTQIGYIVVISVALYVIWTAIRLLVWLIRGRK
ncbi:MAG: hypothetical protein IJK55_09000 [Bacteroidales bacterium]|nr:hypothetical protein [Bacteroidales bacterium]